MESMDNNISPKFKKIVNWVIVPIGFVVGFYFSYQFVIELLA